MRHPPSSNLSKLYQAFLVLLAKKPKEAELLHCVSLQGARDRSWDATSWHYRKKIASENQPGPQVDSFIPDSPMGPCTPTLCQAAQIHRVAMPAEEGCSHPGEGTTKP